jgi:Mce-associated membrane protein
MTSGRPVNKVSQRMRPAPRSGENTTRQRTSRVTTRSPRQGAPTGKIGSRTVKVAGSKAAADRAEAAARSAGRSFRLPRVAVPSVPQLRASGWGLGVGMLVAAVAVTAVAVVAFLRPGVDDGNKAFVDSAATQQITAAADNALKTIYSYDVKNIDGYKDAVHKVVTGKMRGDFDKFADTTVSAVKQAQSTATATPDPVGVTLLTGDRAELLVDLTVAATKNGVPQESASGPIVLRMQKIDGHWLASEIADR